MKLLKALHRPDGIPSLMPDGVPSHMPDRVRRAMAPDPDALISCVWEYGLPSGKTGTCGAPATWELVYKTSMRQPFGASGNVMLHTYRCDRHHTQEETA